MQTSTEVLNIGADVAKDDIVVACSVGSFPTRTLANQRTASLAFLKSLPAGSRIGMESTGTYHELFANAAHQFGFIVFVLNPKDARHSTWPSITERLFDYQLAAAHQLCFTAPRGESR